MKEGWCCGGVGASSARTRRPATWHSKGLPCEREADRTRASPELVSLSLEIPTFLSLPAPTSELYFPNFVT